MAICQYRYNATELYQRTPPGTGVESCCGAPAYPARDVPEVLAVRQQDDDGNAWLELVPTGQLVDREQADPHCPLHGGSPEPPRKVVTLHELQSAHDELAELAAAYDGDPALVQRRELAAAGQRPEDPAAPSTPRQLTKSGSKT